jgi:hypothetical protein
MSPLGLVFLVIIAISTLVQALLLGALTVAAFRARKRLGDFQKRASREIPRLARQAGEAAERVADATERVRRAVELPLAPIRTVRAVGRAVQRAVSTYRGTAAVSRP